MAKTEQTAAEKAAAEKAAAEKAAAEKAAAEKAAAEKAAAEKAAADAENLVEVPGMTVEVGGIAVHTLDGETEYSVTLNLPRRECWRMYLKEGAEMALRKKSLNYAGVVSYPVDDEKETMVPVSFIGKDPRELSRDEIFMAKCYYGLRGIKCAEDVREARIKVYKQLCTLLELPVPENDLMKTWPELVMRRLRTPAGDTLTAQTQPIRFIPDGDTWIKKVIIEKR